MCKFDFKINFLKLFFKIPNAFSTTLLLHSIACCGVPQVWYGAHLQFACEESSTNAIKGNLCPQECKAWYFPHLNSIGTCCHTQFFDTSLKFLRCDHCSWNQTCPQIYLWTFFSFQQLVIACCMTWIWKKKNLQ
jgi:hypothetical protein